jgi:gliding-associated putative ABC transporter substrate-binding component GldG
MNNNKYVTIILLAGILLLLNILSNQFFFRLDLTEGKQYTLSRATRDILRDLEDPVTVKAYFSEELPPDIAKTKRDFQDLLVEYANRSKGNVDYQFISPEEDADQQEALQSGVQPVMINVREKDQVKQQQAFMGAVVQMGEQQDVIPFIQPGAAMEYALSTSIKKLSVVEKPSVGLIQGHGEPGLSELGQAFQMLSILYNVENIDLLTEENIADRFRAVAIVAPQDSFPAGHLQKLDDYLGRGGRLFVAVNRVNGDLSTAQGSEVTTGLETWLSEKGLSVDPSFVIDAQCGSVTVQQRQGFFTINTPVQFPYLPILSNFAEHPVTEGLEQVILPFASPVRFSGDSSLVFTPLAYSSSQAGVMNTPLFFDVNRQWTAADFPMGNVIIGGVLEGNIVGNIPSRMIVFGDGDFPVSGAEGRAQGQDNISLMVNSIDWLSDDTGLIELRTRGVQSRPIDQKYLGEEADGKRTMIKYLNFGLPILLILLYGFFNLQRQRNKRIKLMQEKYG